MTDSLLFGLFLSSGCIILGLGVWSSVINLKRSTLFGKIYVIIHVMDTIQVFLMSIQYLLPNDFTLLIEHLVIFIAGIWTAFLSIVRLIVIASPFYRIRRGLFWCCGVDVTIVYLTGVTLSYRVVTNRLQMLIYVTSSSLPVILVLLGTGTAIFLVLRKPNPSIPISPEKRAASWTIIYVNMIYFGYYCSVVALFLGEHIYNSNTLPVTIALRLFTQFFYVFHSAATPLIVTRGEIRDVVRKCGCCRKNNTVNPE